MVYNGGMKHHSTHFAELSVALLAIDRHEFDRAVSMLEAARDKNASVWLFGNGGSAATASHFANDLTKMCKMKAFALTGMIPTMLAYGNDDGWDHMFSHMLDVYQDRNDVLVAISCSGNSENVVQAVRSIVNVIILTGNEFVDNKLVHTEPSGKHVIIPAMSDDITIQEDVHMAVCHAVAKALRK